MTANPQTHNRADALAQALVNPRAWYCYRSISTTQYSPDELLTSFARGLFAQDSIGKRAEPPIDALRLARAMFQSSWFVEAQIPARGLTPQCVKDVTYAIVDVLRQACVDGYVGQLSRELNSGWYLALRETAGHINLQRVDFLTSNPLREVAQSPLLALRDAIAQWMPEWCAWHVKAWHGRLRDSSVYQCTAGLGPFRCVRRKCAAEIDVVTFGPFILAGFAGEGGEARNYK